MQKKFAKSGMFNVPLQRLLKKLLLVNYSVTTRGSAVERLKKFKF